MDDNRTDHPLQSISLKVKNLDRSSSFYQDHLGFFLHKRESQRAWLGAPGDTFLELLEHPGGDIPRRSTGLYHFAVLLPDRLSLARCLKHMIQTDTPMSGFADHGVSEALYLQDPDGNGIEIYRDRPRSEWPVKEGRLDMVTEPLRTQQLLDLLVDDPDPWQGLPEGTRLGHVHLRVNNISTAETFYRDVLGMELMQRYGSGASFFSYSSYHHHIGVNTWNSKGASPPPPDAPGLGWMTLKHHPDMDLDSSGTTSPPPGVDQSGQWVKDPAGNRFLIQESRA